MTDTIKITDKEKACADMIVEKISKFSTAQLIRVLGICEGISLATEVEKANQESKGA